jgi:hypothetical protein
MDGVAMLVLACGIRRDTGRAYQLHDVDQHAIVRSVTKRTWLVGRGEDIYPTIREACAVARAGTPGPVMVEVPVDLYLFRHDVDPDSWRAPEPPAPPAIDPAAVARAAAILNAVDCRPLIYLGLGAANAGADLVALAERLAAPVATTFQGKGVFPESHPLFLWNGFGPAAPPFARDVSRGPVTRRWPSAAALARWAPAATASSRPNPSCTWTSTPPCWAATTPPRWASRRTPGCTCAPCCRDSGRRPPSPTAWSGPSPRHRRAPRPIRPRRAIARAALPVTRARDRVAAPAGSGRMPAPRAAGRSAPVVLVR